MPMVFLKIDDATKKKIAKIEVPGKREDEDSYHITMFHFQKNTSKEIILMFELLNKELTKHKHFTFNVSKIETFPAESPPIFLKAESERLHILRAKIAKIFDKNNLDYSKVHGDYKPHCTLSYGTNKHKDYTDEINPIQIKANTIGYYSGYGKKVLFEIPIGMKMSSLDELDCLSKIAEEDLFNLFID